MKSNTSFIKSPCKALFSIILLFIQVQTACSQVKAWEGTITIPTYGWEDDVNSKFWAKEAWAKGASSLNGSETQNNYKQLCAELRK
ncbi:MAG: hypothetical protein ACJA2S_003588 [Cyclobacteriaceae bacterium]|jgi:hypothetical protein